MSNTYTWSLPNNALVTLATLDGQSEVVTAVRYEVSGTDGTHTESFSGVLPVTYAEGQSFTPFASLTETQVLGWIQADEKTVSHAQSRIDAQIAHKTKPRNVREVRVNPWSAE